MTIPRRGRAPVTDRRRAARHLPALARARRLVPGRRGCWSARSGCPTPNGFARYLRPDELHTAFNFDFMGCPWDAAALRESIDSTLAAHAPVDAPATWVLANHDVTRAGHPLRARRHVLLVRRQARGHPDRPRRSATAGPAPRRCSRWRCPARCTSTRATSSACPRSRTSRPTALQDPMFFRAGRRRSRAATAAGCRCPGPAPVRRTASARMPDVRTWLDQPDDWAGLTVEPRADDAGSMLSLYRAGLRLRRTERRRRRRAGLVAQRRGSCSRSPAAAASPASSTSVPVRRRCPTARLVLLASAPLEGGQLPQDTTAWLELAEPPGPDPRPGAEPHSAPGRTHRQRTPGNARPATHAQQRTPSNARPANARRLGVTTRSDNEVQNDHRCGGGVGRGRSARCVQQRQEGDQESDAASNAASNVAAANSTPATSDAPVTISVASLHAGQHAPTRSSSSTPRSRSSRRPTRTSRSSPSSTSGRVRPSRPSSPPAPCRPCSPCRSPTAARSARTASSPTYQPVQALPYYSKYNPAVLAEAEDRGRQGHRATDRGLRAGAALQPEAVHAGRPRPRQAADDVGRGRRRRQADHAEDRRRRLQRDGQERQHRRLDPDHAGLLARRPDGDGHRQGAKATARQRRRPSRRCRRCTTCAGTTTRWARTSTTAGRTSTRPSPRARSACTSAARTSTPPGAGQQASTRASTVWRPCPLGSSSDAGVLGGGTLAAVRPDAEGAEKAAAVKWIDFYYEQPLVDKDAGGAQRQDAEGRQAAGRHARAAGLQQGAVRPGQHVDQAATSTSRRTR